jgi:hypothetical protein
VVSEEPLGTLLSKQRDSALLSTGARRSTDSGKSRQSRQEDSSHGSFAMARLS